MRLRLALVGLREPSEQRQYMKTLVIYDVLNFDDAKIGQLQFDVFMFYLYWYAPIAETIRPRRAVICLAVETFLEWCMFCLR